MTEGGLCLLLITKDEADRAVELLEDLDGIVDEVVVADSSGERDHNKLVNKLGGFGHAHILSLPPLGFAEPYRSYALGKVCSEWVLMLDSDERINGELKADIKRILANTSVAGLRILREPLVYAGNGYVAVGSGWPKTRLFRRSATRFFGFIHEQPTVYGAVETLPTKYRMIHYIDKQAYWRKTRRYTKLAVFLDRPQYSDFMGQSTIKRASLHAYLLLRGRRIWGEVSPRELLLFKRLGSPGLKKKLTYRPNESLRRTVTFMSALGDDVRRFSFDVWLDVKLAGGATPYLGLSFQEVWENIAVMYHSNNLAAEDFFISLLIDEFYKRNPTHEPHLSKHKVIEELNRAADIAFPETVCGGTSQPLTPHNTATNMS